MKDKKYSHVNPIVWLPIIKMILRKSGPFNGKTRNTKRASKSKTYSETKVKPKKMYGSTQNRRINKRRA